MWFYNIQPLRLPKSRCRYFEKLILAFILLPIEIAVNIPYYVVELFREPEPHEGPGRRKTFFQRLEYIGTLIICTLLLSALCFVFYSIYFSWHALFHVVNARYSDIKTTGWLFQAIILLCVIVSAKDWLVMRRAERNALISRGLAGPRKYLLIEWLKDKNKKICGTIEWHQE